MDLSLGGFETGFEFGLEVLVSLSEEENFVLNVYDVLAVFFESLGELMINYSIPIAICFSI